MASDLAAAWEVPLNDKVHRIELEHGTTTGRRVVRVDGEEIIRRDWMFKLVGNEKFEIAGQTKCHIQIRANTGFSYEYTLMVNGKMWKKFKETHAKATKTWLVAGTHRIVLDKDSLNVWVDGVQVQTDAVFGEEGTEIGFPLATDSELPIQAQIRTISSGNAREGIIYCLILDGQEIPESFDSAS